MITTYDSWKADDSAYRNDREETCDNCGVIVSPDKGSAVILDEGAEAWWCFECCELKAGCSICGLGRAQCECDGSGDYDFDDSMDGDAGSALESVYGPDD